MSNINKALLIPFAYYIKRCKLSKRVKISRANFANKKTESWCSAFMEAANTLCIQNVLDEASFTSCPESMGSETKKSTVQNTLL